MALRKQVYFKDSEMLELVEEFLSKQTSFSDSIMYLIEKEIAENGIRNLGEFIPQVRSKEYWAKLLANSNNTVSNITSQSTDKPIDNEPDSQPSEITSEPSPSSELTRVSPFRIIENDENNLDDDVDIPSCYE